MITTLTRYDIYTDGSSRKDAGITFGGWAYEIIKDTRILRSESGGKINVTNQQMELYAAIQALEFIKDKRQFGDEVYIYSDSAYLINCANQGWYHKWVRNGWRNSKDELVANISLWQQLIPYFENNYFHFKHVDGHADNFRNNQVDKLAQAESKKLKENWRGLDNVKERELLSGF